MPYANHTDLMYLTVTRIGRTHRYYVVLMFLGRYGFMVSDEIHTLAKAKKELSRISRLLRRNGRVAQLWQQWNNVCADIRALAKETTSEPS